MEQKSLQRTALFLVSMSAFIAPMMLSGVNVAIPAIAREFATTATVTSWIPLAYLLSSAVFMLPAGRIADSHGRKRVYLGGMIIVTLASLLAAAADSIVWLLLCRALQGMGSAMLFATGAAILTSAYPPSQRGGAIGISVSAVYLGLTCGPMLGGWATSAFGWRATFLIHLPLAALVIGVTALKLRVDWKDERPRKFDLRGSLLYGGAIFALMFGLSKLPQGPGFAWALLGCAGFALFFRHVGRVVDPVFDVSLFRGNRMFTFSCLAALAIYSATFGVSYLMSLYLQNIKGMTPQSAGVVMIGQPLIMALLSPVTGRLSDRCEPRVIASLGVVFVSTGLALAAGLTADSAVGTVFFYLMLTGLGFALFSPPNVNAIMGSVGKSDLGLAAGSVSTMRVLGQMASMAVITVMFALLVGPVEIASLDADLLMRSISLSLLAAACIAATGLPLSWGRGAK